MSGLVLPLLVAMSVMPSASGQVPSNEPEFSIDAVTVGGGPLAPDLGSVEVVVDWTYSLPTAAHAAIGAVATSTTLQWDAPVCVGDNGGVIVTGPRTQSVRLTEGAVPQQSVSDRTFFHVSATRMAPGERAIGCAVTGKVLSPGGTTLVADSNPATAEFSIEVAFLGILTAEVPVTIQEAAPRKEISYDVKLTNLGNALVRTDFQLQGEVPAGWIAQAPVPTVIQSLQQGAPYNSVVVHFLVLTPAKEGWNNDDTSFALLVTPSSTKDANQIGNELILPVIARVRGLYCTSDAEPVCAEAIERGMVDCDLDEDAECRAMILKHVPMDEVDEGVPSRTSPAAAILPVLALAILAARRR